MGIELPPCEKCGGTDNVIRFYGREHIDIGDDWWACFECRWPYLRTRTYGPDSTGPPGNVVVPESEPEPLSGQTGMTDFY